MDYMGYFEVQSFEKIKMIKELFESVNLEFSDSGFYYKSEDDELIELKSQDVVGYEDYLDSIATGDGKISQWASDDIQLFLSCITLNDKNYVLFTLPDRDLTILGENLRGKTGLIEFFLKLYLILEADSAFLSTETNERTMIRTDDVNIRSDFIDGVYLAINPAEEDIRYIEKIEYFHRDSFRGIVYFERLPAILFT